MRLVWIHPRAWTDRAYGDLINRENDRSGFLGRNWWSSTPFFPSLACGPCALLLVLERFFELIRGSYRKLGRSFCLCLDLCPDQACRARIHGRHCPRSKGHAVRAFSGPMLLMCFPRLYLPILSHPYRHDSSSFSTRSPHLSSYRRPPVQANTIASASPRTSSPSAATFPPRNARRPTTADLQENTSYFKDSFG